VETCISTEKKIEERLELLQRKRKDLLDQKRGVYSNESVKEGNLQAVYIEDQITKTDAEISHLKKKLEKLQGIEVLIRAIILINGKEERIVVLSDPIFAGEIDAEGFSIISQETSVYKAINNLKEGEEVITEAGNRRLQVKLVSLLELKK